MLFIVLVYTFRLLLALAPPVHADLGLLQGGLSYCRDVKSCSPFKVTVILLTCSRVGCRNLRNFCLGRMMCCYDSSSSTSYDQSAQAMSRLRGSQNEVEVGEVEIPSTGIAAT